MPYLNKFLFDRDELVIYDKNTEYSTTDLYDDFKIWYDKKGFQQKYIPNMNNFAKELGKWTHNKTRKTIGGIKKAYFKFNDDYYTRIERIN